MKLTLTELAERMKEAQEDVDLQAHALENSQKGLEAAADAIRARVHALLTDEQCIALAKVIRAEKP